MKQKFRVQLAPDGTIASAEPVTERHVYLDTADLRYLALGRINKDTTRPIQWRVRLRELLAAGRARLLISDSHASELGKATREALAELLHGWPNVDRAATSTVAIYRAELEGLDVAVVSAPLDTSQLTDLRIETRIPGVPLTNERLARQQTRLGRMIASAHDKGKTAKKADRSSGMERSRNRMARAFLRGSVAPDFWEYALQRPYRLLAAPHYVALAGVVRVLRLQPRVRDFLDRVATMNEYGLHWAQVIAPSVTLPLGPTTRWPCDLVRKMPATALRGAVEYGHLRDLNLPYGDGTMADLEHLAHVGHADVATIDGTNFELTKAVRRHLNDVAIFGTGNLDPVLDRLEGSE